MSSNRLMSKMLRKKILGTSLWNWSFLRFSSAKIDSLKSKLSEVVSRVGEGHPDTVNTLLELGGEYTEEKKYDNAKEIFTRALSAQKTTLGEKHADVANTLLTLGMITRFEGKPSEALKFSQSAKDIFLSNGSKFRPSAAFASEALALAHKDNNENSKAIKEYENARKIYEDEWGKYTSQMGDVLHQIAALKAEMNDYENALNVFEEALNVKGKLYGPENIELIPTLDWMFHISRITGKLNLSEEFIRRSLEIRRQQTEDGKMKKSDLIVSLNNLSLILSLRERIQEAKSVLDEALSLCEENDTNSLALTLTNMTELHVANGNFEEAEKTCLKALEATNKDKKTEASAVRYRRLASIQCNIGPSKFEGAERNFKRALEDYSDIFGEEDKRTLGCMNDLCALYSVQTNSEGNKKKGIDMCSRAISLAEKIHGPDSSEIISSLYNLSNLYSRYEEHKKSVPLLKRIVRIVEASSGKNSTDAASIHTSLGAAFSLTNAFDDAEKEYRVAVSIIDDLREATKNQKDGKSNRVDLAAQQTGISIQLANLLRSQKLFLNARSILDKAIVSAEEAFGRISPQIAFVREKLAGCVSDSGSFVDAVAEYERAIEIREAIVKRNLSKDDSRYAKQALGFTLMNLAGVELNMRDFKNSKLNAIRGIDILKEVLGDDSEDVAGALLTLFRCHIGLKESEKAIESLTEARRIFEKKFGPEHPLVKTCDELLVKNK